VYCDGVAPGAFKTTGWKSGGTKALARGNIGEAHQGMHDGQLPEMIRLEAGNALAVG
jgi:hypothetical protein